jgi:4-hydroxyacetophenone monooxygenase
VTGAKSIEIKKEVFDKYQAELDAQTAKLIWESEGAGYFLNKHGRQQVNMPWTNAEYFPRIRNIRMEEFNIM